MPTDTGAKTKSTKAQREAEARRAATNDAARTKLRALVRSMTQRDWLETCRALGVSRDQIADDDNLTLLAAAYAKERQEHGAASWETLLDLTDRDLLELHGFVPMPLEDEDTGGD